MPITFTITCDSEQELENLFYHLRYNSNGLLSQEAISHTLPKLKNKPKLQTRPVKKTTTKSSPSQKRSSAILPLIESTLNDVIRKGKPFRSKDVIQLIMKKDPSLKESSVTTGVIKRLREARLKWEKVTESVGRPYKRYIP